VYAVKVGVCKSSAPRQEICKVRKSTRLVFGGKCEKSGVRRGGGLAGYLAVMAFPDEKA